MSIIIGFLLCFYVFGVGVMFMALLWTQSHNTFWKIVGSLTVSLLWPFAIPFALFFG